MNETFCATFHDRHPYAGSYVMIEAADARMAKYAFVSAHGQEADFQIFTERAFFETRERWHWIKLATIVQQPDGTFAAQKRQRFPGVV